jgi:hypothetical protein
MAIRKASLVVIFVVCAVVCILPLLTQSDIAESATPSAVPVHDIDPPVTAAPRTARAPPTAMEVVQPESDCFDAVGLFPVSPLEQEIRRLYDMTLAAVHAMNATAWPTDATLLGMMRNGRVATDRDIDMQIHSTYKGCHALLSGVKKHFAKLGVVKSFKVVTAKHKTLGKIGRYAMVRMKREFGTFDTGVDFNCVFTDEPDRPTYYVHRGTLEPVPAAVYPLGRCRFYDKVVPCPRDGYSVLASLKPRYDGCMVFPHCFGDPLFSTRRCMSPHPTLTTGAFLESTKKLAACGYTNMVQHFNAEPQCKAMLQRGDAGRKCEVIDGKTICFSQAFSG